MGARINWISNYSRTCMGAYGCVFYKYDFKILGVPGLACKHPYVYEHVYGCY